MILKEKMKLLSKKLFNSILIQNSIYKIQYLELFFCLTPINCSLANRRWHYSKRANAEKYLENIILLVVFKLCSTMAPKQKLKY